jgi:hypothetical protein
MGTPEMVSDYGTTPRTNNKETDDDYPRLGNSSPIDTLRLENSSSIK